ncbi:MAG: hypothetical protein ACRDHU_04270 [Actinomycetota bacterium]
MDPGQGRSRRIAPVLAAFAVVVAAVWVVATRALPAPAPRSPTPPPRPTPAATAAPTASFESGASARIGFVGLPPEGATPSAPRNGRLVLSYFGRQFTHWYQVWVYADGRLIWQREGDLREGANAYATGYLEQRLSSEGVQLLRRRGSAEEALFGFPWRPPYPASWLPQRAWDNSTIRAYVPSRYAICYQGLLRPIERSEILAGLPAPAGRLLRGGNFDPSSVEGWRRGFGGGCSGVSTGDARRLARILEGAGYGQDRDFQKAYMLTYYLTSLRSIRKETVIRFEPILPHGEVGCTSCGEGRRLETTPPA